MDEVREQMSMLAPLQMKEKMCYHDHTDQLQ